MDSKGRQSKLNQLKESGINCACFNIRKAARSVTQFYEDVMRPTGLRATQYSILRVAEALGPITVIHLAEAVVTDRTTLTRNLKVLEKHRFIRIARGNDRRERKITLTSQGHKVLANAFPLWKQAQKEVVNRLGEDCFCRLLSDLSQVMAVIKAS